MKKRITRLFLPSAGLVISITALISLLTKDIAGLIFAIGICMFFLGICLLMDMVADGLAKGGKNDK